MHISNAAMIQLFLSLGRKLRQSRQYVDLPKMRQKEPKGIQIICQTMKNTVFLEILEKINILGWKYCEGILFEH